MESRARLFSLFRTDLPVPHWSVHQLFRIPSGSVDLTVRRAHPECRSFDSSALWRVSHLHIDMCVLGIPDTWVSAVGHRDVICQVFAGPALPPTQHAHAITHDNSTTRLGMRRKGGLRKTRHGFQANPQARIHVLPYLCGSLPVPFTHLYISRPHT